MNFNPWEQYIWLADAIYITRDPRINFQTRQVRRA